MEYYSEEESALFSDFFSLLYERPIAVGGVEILCRDFLLVTPDEQQVILASATPATIPTQSPNTNPHSLDCLGSLDHVTLYLVRLSDGQILDRLHFPSDYIFLAHHAGVSLCGRHLAITSVQHQLILLYWIDPVKGRFVQTGQVGHSLYLDDRLTRIRSGSNPFEDTSSGVALLGIRQRLMAWFYRTAQTQEHPRRLVAQLYLDWRRLTGLCIWKAQWLDTHHLFLKLGDVDQLAGRQFDPTVVFFLIYHIPTTRILAVWSGDDLELYGVLSRHQESFRILPNTTTIGQPNYTTHPGNSLEEAYLWNRQWEIINQNNQNNQNNHITALRRILANLPYSSQTGAGELAGGLSPYLDSCLFRWNERVVGPGDRAKPSSEYPVRFFRRCDRKLAFRLDQSEHEGSRLR